jgi:hypothetical protein
VRQLFLALSFIWKEFFVRSWWVWVCSIVCFGLYERACLTLNQEIAELQSEISLCSKKLELVMHKQEELKLQLGSLQDPATIEQILIQHLGVVPEGYTKVYFINETISP